VLKNKHQAVSQGAWRFGKRSPPAADEHLQESRNAGSRLEAPFSNRLLKFFAASADIPTGSNPAERLEMVS